MIPTRNGVRLTINCERFEAIFGNPVDMPAPNPPMILPTKFPIANPILDSKSPPEEMRSFTPGILDNPPRAANIPAMIATKLPNPIAPCIAAAAGIRLITTHIPVITTNRLSNAVADASVCLTGNCPTKYNIPANAPIINVITPTAIKVVGIMFPNLFIIPIETASDTKTMLRAADAAID